MLPWQQKQVLITLLLEGIRTSYLVHSFLEATAIFGIACCYGYLVTMATEVGAYNIAFLRYKNFIFRAHIPWGNSNLRYNLLLWIPCYHGKKAGAYFECIRISYLVHTFLEATAISGITCCYGYLVTMATEAGAYNIAFWRYKNFMFGAQIPGGNSNLWLNCCYG